MFSWTNLCFLQVTEVAHRPYLVYFTSIAIHNFLVNGIHKYFSIMHIPAYTYMYKFGVFRILVLPVLF